VRRVLHLNGLRNMLQQTEDSLAAAHGWLWRRPATATGCNGLEHGGGRTMQRGTGSSWLRPRIGPSRLSASGRAHPGGRARRNSLPPPPSLPCNSRLPSVPRPPPPPPPSHATPPPHTHAVHRGGLGPAGREPDRSRIGGPGGPPRVEAECANPQHPVASHQAGAARAACPVRARSLPSARAQPERANPVRNTR
jgi:hypothetical protein